jgi:multimeric flavodoxin WrbA
MDPIVLGISGSPVQNSNTDRLVKYVLENTRLEFEFIKLSELEIHPCKACKNCAKTNVCTGFKDDWHLISAKVAKAEAFVIGGWSPYDMLDARTKAFLERMFCLRHLVLLNEGKLGVAIVTGTCNPDSVADRILEYFSGEGIIPLGKIVASGIDACWSCGLGEECIQGTPIPMVREGYRPRNYPYENRLPLGMSIKITPEIIPPRVEDQLEVMEEAKRLGKLIADKLKEKKEKRKVLLEKLLPQAPSLATIDSLMELIKNSHSLGWITDERIKRELDLKLLEAKTLLEKGEREKARCALLEFAKVVLYQTGISVSQNASDILVGEARQIMNDLYDSRLYFQS